MQIRRYCLVIELKEEKIKEYCDVHRNPPAELLDAIKDGGAKELLIWNYKNLSIVYYECEDLDKLYERLGKLDIIAEWNALTGPWFEQAPALDGSGSVKSCEKIFDLNQQLSGKLKKF
jgi:L-rhamnose mutarotase